MDKILPSHAMHVQNPTYDATKAADQSTVKKTMEVAFMALFTAIPAALMMCAKTFNASSLQSVLPVAIWLLLGVVLTVATALTETPKDWPEQLKKADQEWRADADGRERRAEREEDAARAARCEAECLQEASSAMHEPGKQYVRVGSRS